MSPKTTPSAPSARPAVPARCAAGWAPRRGRSVVALATVSATDLPLNGPAGGARADPGAGTAVQQCRPGAAGRPAPRVVVVPGRPRPAPRLVVVPGRPGRGGARPARYASRPAPRLVVVPGRPWPARY